MNAMGTKTIIKARVTFVFNGYGDLTLTDKAIIWNKSASSFLTFGITNSLTNNHIMIPLENISKITTYTYVTGGLVIIDNNGQEYKFGFKHKKDFKIVYTYLVNYMNNKINE